MASDVEFWRQDRATKAKGIAQDVEQLSRRARAAGLAVTAYVLEVAASEARKEARTEEGKNSTTRAPSGFLWANN
jgi:hypothetical protein